LIKGVGRLRKWETDLRNVRKIAKKLGNGKLLTEREMSTLFRTAPHISRALSNKTDNA
jgi:hypothetical protein